MEVPLRGRYNAWFAAVEASLKLRRASFRWSGAAMRLFVPRLLFALSFACETPDGGE